MAHAEICPICGGKGYIEEDTGTTGGKRRKICHGCGGKGWIEVSDALNKWDIWYPYSITWETWYPKKANWKIYITSY